MLGGVSRLRAKRLDAAAPARLHLWLRALVVGTLAVVAPGCGTVRPSLADDEAPVDDRAEIGLLNSAIAHHNIATRLRRRSVEERDADSLAMAMTVYGFAVDAYRVYIESTDDDATAYEVQYNLGDALFWSERYDEAAEAYATVRDSTVDDRFLGASGRRVVVSYERLLEAAVARGESTLRDAAPNPGAEPPVVIPEDMPDEVRRVFEARDSYLARVDEAHDEEHVRAAYAFNNALLLYVYGHWDEARARFSAIYLAGCDGRSALPIGRDAWANLRDIAVALHESDEVSRLEADLVARRCAPELGGSEPLGPVDTARP